MNKAVQITLAEPFGSFVDSQVESGRFGSAQEVVEAALGLLRDEEARVEWLRNALIEGENSGPSEVMDRDAFMTLMRESRRSRD